MSDLQGSTKQIEDHIDYQVYASRSLDAATFGLATAFAFKVVQGASLATNSAKNLALSAGATYTAGSLFFPRANEALYLNADLALVCIANRGNGLLTAYDQANATLSTGPGIDDQSGNRCPNWDTLEQELVKAKATKQTVKNSEADFAAKLTDAGNNVLTTLAQQLFAQYPSPEAILNSGKSAMASAGALMPHGANLFGVGPRAAAKVCAANVQASVDAAMARYQSISTLLSQRMNAIGDLSQGCAATVANPIKPLSVSQQDVTLNAGDNNGFVLSVEGGRTPIRPQWIRQDPKGAAAFSWVVPDRSIRVYAPSSGAKGGPFTLQFVDSAVVPATLEVNVTVK
ncbi:hypothetical protein [Cupriavidus basilensis]|uniref:hypothetical protein n=1 Tax=Cupriavidus basilensis TaxID=68895 RepID=UPI0023E85BA6|nr:hypothetical protein [Cupriavidus basilensis]MDF3886686.1 hypothetical protein [Cupriavidus basilensis]